MTGYYALNKYAENPSLCKAPCGVLGPEGKRQMRHHLSENETCGNSIQNSGT
jgi:hypothetical protein